MSGFQVVKQSVRLCVIAVVALGVWSHLSIASAQKLTLAEAESKTLTSDPLSKQFKKLSLAQEDMAIASAQLPDPQVSFRALNLPTDTFDPNQEAMTQFQVGVFQKIPNSNLLSARAEISSALSRVDRANGDVRRLLSIKAVRLSWLEALYWRQFILILEDYKDLIEDDIRSTEAMYSSGKISAQRVLEAELASSLLDDRSLTAFKNLDIAKANLGKWMGENISNRSLSDEKLSFTKPLPQAEFEDNLLSHPEIAVLNEKEGASKKRVKVAQARYAPDFGVGASYGYRQDTLSGNSRSDLVSLKFSMSVPLFTNQRQDRNLSARKLQAAAARLKTDEKMRELARQYEVERTAYNNSLQRLMNFDEQILSRAKDNMAAAITAYQYEASDFDALVRARVSELEAQLKRLRLDTESQKSLVRLQYLQGEPL